ncbi:MAG: DUF87 domain-containing protein [Pseudomonadota bacterium]
MRIVVGKSQRTGEPVILDTKRAINAHLQVSGITGMGKTHTLQELISAIVESAAEMGKPIRVHVFDAHGDIKLPFCSEVKFTEATQYGYNPLEINPHPDFGGVRRAIQKFMVAIKKLYSFGAKQEAVMRYLLEDLFVSRGFKADDPKTWIPDNPLLVRGIMESRGGRIYVDVSYEQRARFKELIMDSVSGRVFGGFDDFSDFASYQIDGCWWVEKEMYEGDLLMWEPKNIFKVAPTIDDAVRFVERKLKGQFLGTNGAAVTLLGDVNRAARAFHRKVDEKSKRAGAATDEEIAKLEKDLKTAKEKLAQAFSSYMDAIQTGRELDDIIRYNSVDVLMAVYERWQNFKAKGIYSTEPPPFDGNVPIWKYGINTLEIPTQRLLVDLVGARVLERCMQRGLQEDVIEILAIDEAKRFLGDGGEDILSLCVNEGRKFGLGAWLFSQSPDHFPDDVIKGTGTIIVLGLAAADRKLSARKLGLDERLLATVIPKRTALIQIKNSGVMAQEFEMVELGQ